MFSLACKPGEGWTEKYFATKYRHVARGCRGWGGTVTICNVGFEAFELLRDVPATVVV